MPFAVVPVDTELVAKAVIGAAIQVHRALGPGFLERIYQEALRYELNERGISYESEVPIAVRYKALTIPGQRIDLLVSGRVLVELKAVTTLEPIHQAIVMSYLKTTGLRLGLLMNFHAPTLRDGLKRIVL